MIVSSNIKHALSFIRIACLLSAIASIIITQHAAAQVSIGRLVTQPLRDTRLRDDKIPPILQRSADAPYSIVGLKSCALIRDEIDSLADVLGPDVDTPAVVKGEAAEVAAMAAGEVVKSLIPGLGVVRVITGADKQQRRIEAAVHAGSIRRGFLKGFGLSKKCKPPASPTHDALATTP